VVDPGAIATLTAAAPSITATTQALTTTRFSENDGEKVVLDFVLTSDSNDAQIEQLTLQASGDMNETTRVQSVGLYVDSNDNGIAEAVERIGSGIYDKDNGQLTFEFAQPYQLPVGQSRLLVTYTF